LASHSPAEQTIGQGTTDQSPPYKISLTDDPFASSKVTGEVFSLRQRLRKLLKTYILIPVARNTDNWHSSCTSTERD
jgi:hypothetical protein